MNVNRSHLTRFCSACVLTGAALAGVAQASPAPRAPLSADLALGPSVVGRPTTVELRVADPAGAPLGRLLVSAHLPGGVAYVPRSVDVEVGGADFSISAPRAVAVPSGGTDLYWGNLPAPGHGTLTLDFEVRPGAHSARRWAGSSWSISASVHSDPLSPGLGGPATSTAEARAIDGAVADAAATAHVEPLAVAASESRGVQEVVVSGTRAGATHDVVVRAYLPAGVTLARCSAHQHCAAPTVTTSELPTLPGRAHLPDLHAPSRAGSPNPEAAGATSTPQPTSAPTSTATSAPSSTATSAPAGVTSQSSTGTVGATVPVGSSGTLGAGSTSSTSTAAPASSSTSTSTAAPASSSTSNSATLAYTSTGGSDPVSAGSEPSTTTTTTTATTTAVAHPGHEERFTVLTWHLGTVRAGGKVTERYTVQVTDATGSKASWLVTATASTTADATRQPAVLTVEHLVDWTRPLAERPRIAGATSASASTSTTTVPDPFGSSGSGTTTTTTTTAAGSTGPGTTTPFGVTSTGSSTTGSSTTGSSSAGSSSAGSSSGSGSATSLPYTGVNADLELEVAAAALLLGAGVMVTTRRRPPLTVLPAEAPPSGPPGSGGASGAPSVTLAGDPAPRGMAAALRHSASRLSWPLRRLGPDGGALDGVLARDSLAEASDLDWLAGLADDPGDPAGAFPQAPAAHPAGAGGPPAPLAGPANPPQPLAGPGPAAGDVATGAEPAGPRTTLPVSGVSPLVDVLVPLGGWRDGEWCFDRPLGDLLDPVFGTDPAPSVPAGDPAPSLPAGER